MQRYDCLKAVAPKVSDELVLTNLGNTATEWESLRPHDGNLSFIGMGMVTPYALGLALALPHRTILAFDGDGGILFDLSVFGSIADTAPGNLCVVIVDNEGYVSTGTMSSAQSQSAGAVDIGAVASACGLANVTTVRTVGDFVAAVEAGLADSSAPHVIVAKTDTAQAFVGTTRSDARENKYRFVRHIESLENTRILKPSAREHGEPPKPDPVFSPVTEADPFGQVVFDALVENDVDFVVGLPSSGLADPQARCMQHESMRYVGVANEGTGIGICAGAWLGGKRPAALIENFGLFASVYQLLRGQFTFGIPTLVVAEYRGDAGETEFFGDPGEATEPILAAMGLNHRVVRRMDELKPAMRDGLRWMNFALRPYVILPSFDLSRKRPPGSDPDDR